ncbi:hypothetical protein QYF36_014487 [Acer negundo]|nr:hypothetical protein QYF36_014487 [Acer negundo]
MYAPPMAIVRAESRSNMPAPPPSPIPTGRGSRSAANEILSDYLEKSLNVPELALPESPILPTALHHQNHWIPEEIDLRSLVSREPESINRLLESSREIGAFTIEVHGVSDEELRSLEREAERVFRILEKRDMGHRLHIGAPKDNKEEIVWVRSGNEIMDQARKYIGHELYQSFSEKMECVGSKLDDIAQQVRQVFMESLAGKQYEKRSLEKQNVLSIHKHNHNVADESGPIPEKNKNFHDQIFTLHLPTKQCRYCVQSEKGPIIFYAGPEVIIVTVGKQLEEWSLGEYKCVFGEMMSQPDLQASNFSIELKCPCPSLNPRHSFIKRTHKTISIADQILIALIMAFLYHIFKFLWS